MYIESRNELIRRHSPKLVEVSSLRASGGPTHKVDRYRSYFGYAPSTADVITSQGNTANLKGADVSLDEIVIDVDDASQVTQVRDRLMEVGVQFTQWNSRRGSHFHIPVELMTGPLVVYSVKMWLFSILDVEHFDSSMLHESGQIRQPWSQHDKDVMVVKYPLRTYSGTIPRIPYKEPPPPRAAAANTKESTNELYYEFIRQIEFPRGTGRRTLHLYIITMSGIQAGLSMQTVLMAAKDWNEQRCRPPHPPDYVDRKVMEIWNAQWR